MHPTEEPTNEQLDAELKRLFPIAEDDPQLMREKSLLIFDGTANQKLPILMWMCDQVLTTISEERAKAPDPRNVARFDAIGHSFRATFARIRVLASDLTESFSPYSEDFRKFFIEACARVVQTYRRNVEDLAGISRAPPRPQPDIDRREVEQFIAFSQEQRRQNTSLFNATVNTPLNAVQPNITVTTPPIASSKTKPTSLTPPHYEIPRAAVPMTPICGVPNSRYVSPKPKGINIHEGAYADAHREISKIPYNIHVNDTYEEVLQNVPKNLTYVGALYPDGSSLSYLPIKHITLLRQADVQLPTRDEGGVVEILIPRVIYRRIKELCAEAYLQKYPDHTIRFPFECIVNHYTVKIQALARGYRRMRIINGEKVFHVSLIQALQECSHDMTGDGLLHLRFDRPNSEFKRATMKIIFFGLQLVRDASNHFQKIFRL